MSANYYVRQLEKGPRSGSNDHVLAPIKNVVPLPFKVSSADPQTTIYNAHVLNDRDRENSIPCTRGGGRVVTWQPRYSLCEKFTMTVPARGSRAPRHVSTRQLDTMRLSGND